MKFCENSTFPYFLAMCHIFPIAAFANVPQGNNLEEISTKIKHKKQIFGGNCCENRTKIKHKTKLLEGNAVKIVLFEK